MNELDKKYLENQRRIMQCMKGQIPHKPTSWVTRVLVFLVIGTVIYLAGTNNNVVSFFNNNNLGSLLPVVIVLLPVILTIPVVYKLSAYEFRYRKYYRDSYLKNGLPEVTRLRKNLSLILAKLLENNSNKNSHFIDVVSIDSVFPALPGIYALIEKQNHKVIYIGKSDDIADTMSSYLSNTGELKNFNYKNYSALILRFDNVEESLDVFKAYYIDKYKPTLNLDTEPTLEDLKQSPRHYPYVVQLLGPDMTPHTEDDNDDSLDVVFNPEVTEEVEVETQDIN